MEKIARIAVSAATFSIDKPYDYLVPRSLADSLKPGERVTVPFGRGNRVCEGMILSVSDRTSDKKLKSVLSALDESPVIDEGGIRLALWIRSRYFCTFYDAIKTMLPIGLWYRMRTIYTLSEGVDAESLKAACSDVEASGKFIEVFEALGFRADSGQLAEALGSDSERLLAALRKKGLIAAETVAMRKVKDSKTRVAELTVSAEDAMSAVEKKKRLAPVRYEAVKLLCTLGSASAAELCYYTGVSMQALRALEKDGIINLREEERLRISGRKSSAAAEPIVLNSEQQKAFEGLLALMDGGKPEAALLFGVTGSGKTQVYIRLIQEALSRGRTAMVLVPEISLTPQMMDKFTAYFGRDVAMLHSSLRMTERYDQWKRIRRGEVKVVLGTRSAVFAPLENIGLIVMDEEQEGTYQSENPPRYHARDIAMYLCAENSATLVMGSATPAVESAYFAQTGKYKLFSLKNRYNRQPMPKVIIADMKDELRAGNGGDISRLLRSEIERNMAAGEQSILFINRRGNSRMIVCGECGEVPHCPRCSVPLTYHSANGRLMCHYCGHSEKAYERCPSCGGFMKHVGTGTQKAEEELAGLFPGTEILRMDADTVAGAMGHDKILEKFSREKTPILLGTQMVAKGLDFENVTLVGVLAADLSLYVDNYRAAERTFSLLTQVVGRAGRGDKNGRAVIQTYTPENEVILSAAQQDYGRFYKTEIKMRRMRLYPPFSDLFTVSVSGSEESRVLRASSLLRDGMKAASDKTFEIVGPAPAPVLKVNNRYRYRLFLVAENNRKTRDFIAYFIKAFYAEKENRGLNIFVDCNAID
ncbi:MAG: primosomal protein N' [Oscillospiraceae bacterium]|nr:primosomal protein N' [Oscillospiraceae bacterium]